MKSMRLSLLCFVEVPAVVVGVVGMGHVPGIERNWEKQLNISEIMRYVSRAVLTHYGYFILKIVYNCVWLDSYNSPPMSVCLFFSVAPPSRFGWVVRAVIKTVMIGTLGYACYRAGGTLGRALLSLPAVQSVLDTLRPPPAWPHWSSLKPLTRPLISGNNASITSGLKNRRWSWRKGFTSPLDELTRTSGGLEPPTSFWCPCRHSRAVLPKKPWQYSLCFLFILCANPAFCKVYKCQ